MKATLMLALVGLALSAAPFAVAQQQPTTIPVEVYLHEYSAGLHLVPDAMTARVGDTLKLTVHNQGSEHDNGPHWLIVCGDGATVPSVGDDCKDKWGFTGMLQNNQTGILTATAKRAGTFAYYCPIPGHAQAGMAGLLTVKGSGAAEPAKASPGLAVLGSLIALVGVALILRKGRP